MHKEGDPLDNKIVNIGKTDSFNRRVMEYLTGINTLEESYKGREYLIHLAHYKLAGYRIESFVLLEDVPYS